MPNSAEPRIEVIFSAEDIAQRIGEIAGRLNGLGIKRPLIVAVLKGSFVFAADLIRALHRTGMSPEVDFITLSSYKTGTTSSGTVDILRDVEADVAGRDVLLIDDILESGRTLAFAKQLIEARGARRVLTCVLLKKDVPRAVEVAADFHVFDCPAGVFVIGYGMDAAHRYRELPFVGRLISE
ncbi:MAG: phosphoribosyltransferase family protein [Hyphomicrobiaceae bacterium]|nr:phosphoribosyltransferase family protein [Hyphomicrobiaceae bacterium]